MSKKINAEKPIEKTNLPPQNSNNEPQGDTFSFLELNRFLDNENIEREHNKSKNKIAKKKSSYEKGKSEEKHKLKIKPNLNIAREQTSDDMMYIENDDLNKKEEVEKEEKKEKKETNKEKNIPKKQEEKKKAKVDKRLVKLNLNKEKSEEKLKSKDKELNSDKKDKTSKEEKAEIYDIESFINKIKENDPQAYTPIMLPLEKDNTEEKSLKDELMEENEENKNKLFVFQFPRQIPIKDLKNQIKIKEEENVNEEPDYDNNGFLISPEFKNSFQEINNKTVIGKLVIMKSGKLKIKMGDIYFDVNQGCLTKFAQFATVITENKDNQAYILGQPLNKKLIVTPEFD
jgi:hypothetical protein